MGETIVTGKPVLVSIIIPVFNKASYVRETLDSALRQTYPNIELVLVNDGSTDGSLAILKEYQSKSPDKIILIDQANGGVSNATNVGIKESRGEYIQFLDADDLLSPDKIENQIRLLSGKSPKDLVSCKWVNFTDNPSKNTGFPYGVFAEFGSGLNWLMYSWNRQEMMADSSWLTSRFLIESSGPWNESLIINQDGEFFARVLMRSKEIIFDTKSVVYYRSLEEGNVSRQKTYQSAKSLLESFFCYHREILGFEDSERIRMALKRVYLKFIYDIYPLYPDLLQEANYLIKKLGVKEHTPIGGPKFQQISKLIGFRKALWLKRFLQ